MVLKCCALMCPVESYRGGCVCILLCGRDVADMGHQEPQSICHLRQGSWRGHQCDFLEQVDSPTNLSVSVNTCTNTCIPAWCSCGVLSSYLIACSFWRFENLILPLKLGIVVLQVAWLHLAVMMARSEYGIFVLSRFVNLSFSWNHSFPHFLCGNQAPGFFGEVSWNVASFSLNYFGP